MVEQRTENPRVPSSILGLGTKYRAFHRTYFGLVDPFPFEVLISLSACQEALSLSSWIQEGDNLVYLSFTPSR